MNAYDVVPARGSEVVFTIFAGWIDSFARCVIEQAAQKTSATLSERLREEWMADFSELRGLIARLRFAFGCYWAAMIINADGRTVSIPTTGLPSFASFISSSHRHGMRFSSQLINTSGSGSLMCEINTTPLVDIMLVLLITLILSLPIMTHVVKLNLPQTTTSDQPMPEVIDLDIYSDGSVVWNGSPISNLQQLEGYFRAESRKALQPELHLHPNAHVRYDVVAKVLAAAQRNGMNKLSFVNNAEFLN